MRLPVKTVIHTTLVGLEPATLRSLVYWLILLVRRATSSATDSPASYCNVVSKLHVFEITLFTFENYRDLETFCTVSDTAAKQPFTTHVTPLVFI